MSLNKLIKDFFYDVKGYVPTFIEILRVNLGLRKLLEQKIGNYVLSKFKLQARLFMGFFSVVPKSTISLTIAGIVISRHQEGIIQSSYFCYSSKLRCKITFCRASLSVCRQRSHFEVENYSNNAMQVKN